MIHMDCMVREEDDDVRFFGHFEFISEISLFDFCRIVPQSGDFCHTRYFVSYHPNLNLVLSSVNMMSNYRYLLCFPKIKVFHNGNNGPRRRWCEIFWGKFEWKISLPFFCSITPTLDILKVITRIVIWSWVVCKWCQATAIPSFPKD